jgi:hypothetical protein
MLLLGRFVDVTTVLLDPFESPFEALAQISDDCTSSLGLYLLLDPLLELLDILKRGTVNE